MGLAEGKGEKGRVGFNIIPEVLFWGIFWRNLNPLGVSPFGPPHIWNLGSLVWGA